MQVDLSLIILGSFPGAPFLSPSTHALLRRKCKSTNSTISQTDTLWHKWLRTWTFTFFSV